MPLLYDETPDELDLTTQAQPSANEIRSASDALTVKPRGLAETVGGVVGFAPLDLTDVVASSVIPGVNRGDVNQAALNALDMPYLKNFYNEYQGGIEGASAALGIVGTELITRRLTAPGSAFLNTVSKLPYARRIATLDMEYAAAMERVRQVDKALATRGAIGVEQYVGNASLGTLDVNRRAAAYTAKGLGFAKGARNAAVSEGILAATQHTNNFLFDDSAAWNLTWMGLGVGIGGGVDWFHSAYLMRKAVNSDEVRRAFAGALDPSGAEEGRLFWHGNKKSLDGQPASFFGGSITDRVTSLLVSRTNLTESAVKGMDAESARALIGSRDALATQQFKLAQEEMQKVTTKGISGIATTKFTDKTPGYANHLNQIMYRDPGSLYGVEMLGGVADETSVFGVHELRTANLEESIASVESQLLDDTLEPEAADALLLQRQRLDYESKLTPFAYIDGEKVSLSEASAIEQFIEPEIGFSKTDRVQVRGGVRGQLGHDQHGLFEAKTQAGASKVTLDTSFNLHLPGNRSMATADHFDVLRAYRLASKAIDTMAGFKGALTLPKKPTWFQLDMAEAILKKNPAANVVFPAGMSRESAQVESLVQKAEALQGWKPKAKNPEADLAKLRVRYNLPRLTAYEKGLLGGTEHPVEAFLRGVQSYGPDEVRKMDLSEVKNAVAKFKELGDFVPSTPRDVGDLTGNSFTYMLDESGKPLKPMIGYERPFKAVEWTQDHVAERMAASKMQTISLITGDVKAPMSRAIIEDMVNSPDLDLASRTHELMDIQIQGNLAGTAPQSFLGAARNATRTSEWRDRDNPIMLAASRLREAVGRKARDYMKAQVESAMGDTLSLLENPRNASSKLLLNQFHSYRSGWELADKPIYTGDGFHKFVLSDTEANRARFKEAHGYDMPEGQTLLSPSGKEVVLDDLALDTQLRYQSVTDSILNEKNALLRAAGRGEIRKLNWFTPPPNTQGKFIGFTLGPDGKPVPGMTVVEDTQEAFNRSKAALTPKLNELGLGYQFRTQDEIRDFATLWDRAQMDFIDPSLTAVQGGRKSRGALAGSEVKLNAFDQSLQYLRDQYIRQANDLVEVVMKESINSSKARANIAATTTRNRAGFFRDQKYRSIYDMYLENLLGTSKLNSSGTFAGRIYNSIEGSIDKFLEEASPSASKVWTAVNAWVDRAVPFVRSQESRKDFEALSQKLGEYMPFDSTAEMLSRQGANPPTLAKITGGLNRFTAAMVLRMMEVAHPIMNLSGIVNAMPAVIRHMTPRNGETVEEFATRIGHSSSIFQLPDGKQLGVIDMNKLGARAFKRAWSRESEADYRYMVQHGFLSQEVAEFQRQFGAIEAPGKWKSFFEGDKGRATEKGLKGKFYQKGLVGWMSVLSDRSEDFSRSWGHMVGLELADFMGIEGREMRHAFAHDIANKMIANYSPANRPEVFQGALGAPIGLFQSFMLNYYQRMFRYLETKDFQSLGIQYAMQAGMFGVTGVPGYQQLAKLLTDDEGGTPTDGLYERFRGPLADLLGGGVLSSIPRMFGADSVDLYSRGDVNARVPGLPSGTGSPLDAIPGTAVLRKLWQGIGEGFQQFSDSNPGLSGTQLAEVFSNAIANRPIAGMIEQFFAGGNDTDHYGQLVNDTRSASEVAYRLIGLRSQRQATEIDAFYRNKNAMEHENAAKDVLRIATRAAMRDGSFQEKSGEIFTKYLETGGDPKNFRRWIKENYQSATESRAQRQLDKALRSGSMDQALRLIDSGVSVNADQATPDPEELYGADFDNGAEETPGF